MFRFDYALLILGVGAGLLLAGYWLAAALRDVTLGERLAAAVLAGLASLVFAVSAVNFFRPLAGGWAWLCLLPCGCSLAFPSCRRGLVADLQAVRARPETPWLALVFSVFLALLIWPLLHDPDVLFFDGTSNHDNFFWIAGADYLKGHSYLQTPEFSATRPFTNPAGAITEWQPVWGRMGAEGTLAMLSGVSGVTVFRLFNCATAVLLLPWVSAVYLVLRTFVLRKRAGLLVLLAAVGAQPIFVFFYSNGNLPNLFGALLGAGVVVGTERCFRCCLPAFSTAAVLRNSGRGFRVALVGYCWAWWLFLALCFHGLICSYPEMLPFALLPCGLLWLRGWIIAERGTGWRSAAVVAAAFVAGVCLNPATTVRGVTGFLESVYSAQHRDWHNLFAGLASVEIFPALTSLAVGASRHLGLVPGLALSLLLLAMLAQTVWRARDPFGTVALFAGAGLLLVYTWVTGFQYGWQKTAQFAGVFLGAVFPAGCLAALPGFSRAAPWLRDLSNRGIAGVLLVFYAYGTLSNLATSYLYAERKAITRELVALRAVSKTRLNAVPVLVVSESFQKAFFYGMWAAYFFPGSDLMFSARDAQAGGYLREDILIETPGVTPLPAAVFVSHEWAETFDLNSRRLIEGGSFALLENTNRVLSWEGFSPNTGVPRYLATRAELSLIPHRNSSLQLVLRPRHDLPKSVGPIGQLTAENRLQGQVETHKVVLNGPPPWHVVLPLEGGTRNDISLAFDAPTTESEPPFEIDLLRITDEQ